MCENNAGSETSDQDVNEKEVVIVHEGIHARRFAVLDCTSAHREAAFAELWKREQESHTLEYLMGINTRSQISQRDAQVAATVIQWLGSTVGHDFLQRAIAHAEASVDASASGVKKTR